MINIAAFNSRLASTVNNIDFEAALIGAYSGTGKLDSIKSTILGKNFNEALGGILSLTESVDFATGLESIEEVVISKMTKDVLDIKPDVIRTVSNASDINLITGNSTLSANGFLEDAIMQGSPEAIAASVKHITGKNPVNIPNLLGAVQTGDLSGFIVDSLSQDIPADVMFNVVNYIGLMQTALNQISALGLVDAAEKFGKRFETQVQALVDTPITAKNIEAAYILFTEGEKRQSFILYVRTNINKPDDYFSVTNSNNREDWDAEYEAAFLRIEAAELIFNAIEVEISNSINHKDSFLVSIIGAAFGNTRPIKQIGALPNASNANYSTSSGGQAWSFDYIRSEEEIEAYFRNAKRSSGSEIEGMIVHSTETFNDQHLTADWIHEYHKTTLGLDGIAYHMVILKDGSIQNGRPIGLPGRHASGFDENFLGLVFVGGLDEYVGSATKPYSKYQSVNSITPGQWQTYEKIMRAFHKVFPKSSVVGHSDIGNRTELDPGFDVEAYSESRFGHKNVHKTRSEHWENAPKVVVTGRPGSGGGIGGSLSYDLSGKTRNQKLNPQLEAILLAASAETGLHVTVTSGGQDSTGSKRVGTHRHDNGFAADIKISSGDYSYYVHRTSDLPTVIAFATAAKNAGATSIGAAPGYQGGKLHVDIAIGNSIPAITAKGNPAGRYWPKTGRGSPDWLAELMK